MTIPPTTVSRMTMAGMTSMARRWCDECRCYHVAGDAEYPVPCEGGTGKPKTDGAWTGDDLMPFGKHAGLPLRDVPRPYLLWLRDEGCKHRDLMEYLRTL